MRIEKYLPKTICQEESGFVFSISNVPALNSSESERMVIAGTRNIRTQGASSKNLSNDAYPNSKMLLSFKTKRNTPFINKNSIMAIYPVRLLKNWLSSFLQMLHMNF
jgi:hypothetical protein